MSAQVEINWIESNRQALTEELAWLQQLLENSIETPQNDSVNAPATEALTLNFLCDMFQLSSFERTLLLLCAGIELSHDIRALCTKANADSLQDYPTFNLALSILPDAHWDALSPQSPLRHWQLIQLHDPTRITRSRLTIDEQVLHFLLGNCILDQRLASLVQPLDSVEPLPPSQQQQVDRLKALWRKSTPGQSLIGLQGNDLKGAREVAAHACAALDLRLLSLQASDIPVDAEERNLLARLLTREYMLNNSALLVEMTQQAPTQLNIFLEQLECPLILLGSQPDNLHLSSTRLQINKPTSDEQRTLWREALSDEPSFDESQLMSLAAQFDFSATDISATADTIRAETAMGTPLEQALWQDCRQQARGGLEHLAQCITPHANWDDLVLAQGQKQILHDISRQVRHRATVYEAWGFAAKSERGLGISALFAGESGTGKTMAAEVLAADLRLDLYRIDLAAVVSKYIGETEKNLERLFSAAESSGAILLFDEADALFGKRSDVKDSHDRYANIELAYLLQRMEAYRGLSILTSNMKSALDTAFMRRIRFVVQFPFPDIEQRKAIWQRVFPDKLPRAELKTELLARLHVTGGNIRNIAMNAAFLAAEQGDPLNMSHLAQAARMEYAKLEKPLSDMELRQWT